MRPSLLPSLFVVLLLSCCPARDALAQAPSVRPLPQQPLVERLRDGQQLNFDLLFENAGDKPLELVELQLTRFDHAGRFIGQRRLDRNGDGTTMGIATVPNRALPAHGKLVVFKGPVLDQSGTVRIQDGALPTDKELLEMNWFVQGVVGSPK